MKLSAFDYPKYMIACLSVCLFLHAIRNLLLLLQQEISHIFGFCVNRSVVVVVDYVMLLTSRDSLLSCAPSCHAGGL